MTAARPGAVKRLLLVVAVLLAAIALPAAAAPTWYTSPALVAASSWLAQRDVGVRCYASEEPDSPWGHDAWGYVRKPLGKARLAHLDGRLCAGALEVNGALPDWQRALGVLVLTHESYHLRRWGAAGDEAKVECRAIRHWRVVARRLGATEPTIAELWPSALAAHYELAGYVDWFGDKPYEDPTCDVPPLFELEEPTDSP